MSTTSTLEAKVQELPLLALTPACWNPRTIKDDRFQNLCRSLEADPEFLQLRPILATADGTIFAGNMRFRAAQQLGWETIPAILVDIPEALAKERALRDNAQWGTWEEDDLAGLLAELKVSGSDLDLLGFDDRDLQKLLDSLANQGGLTDSDDAGRCRTSQSPSPATFGCLAPIASSAATPPMQTMLPSWWMVSSPPACGPTRPTASTQPQSPSIAVTT